MKNTGSSTHSNVSRFGENSRNHSAFTIGRTFLLNFPEANNNEKLKIKKKKNKWNDNRLLVQ